MGKKRKGVVINVAKIILDVGSGNTCKNNWEYAKRMIDELKAVDTGKHEIIIKWQLFTNAGNNIPLDREIFKKAYYYAKELGYKTTSSVFDKDSLDFLLKYDIPFVKIANNRALDWLIGEVPRKIPVYVSLNNDKIFEGNNIVELYCISKYPATIEEYIYKFIDASLKSGISDHTTNFGLWYKYQPKIIEWHYGLSDSTGLDAGPFMKTPEMLREII